MKIKFEEYRCVYCLENGTPENPITKDHVFSNKFVSKKDEDNEGYLKVPACKECNNKHKSSLDNYFKYALMFGAQNPSAPEFVFNNIPNLITERRNQFRETQKSVKKVLVSGRPRLSHNLDVQKLKKYVEFMVRGLVWYETGGNSYLNLDAKVLLSWIRPQGESYFIKDKFNPSTWTQFPRNALKNNTFYYQGAINPTNTQETTWVIGIYGGFSFMDKSNPSAGIYTSIGVETK